MGENSRSDTSASLGHGNSEDGYEYDEFFPAIQASTPRSKQNRMTSRSNLSLEITAHDENNGASDSHILITPHALQYSSSIDTDFDDDNDRVSRGTQTIKKSLRLKRPPARLQYYRRSREKLMDEESRKRRAWNIYKRRRYSSLRH